MKRRRPRGADVSSGSGARRTDDPSEKSRGGKGDASKQQKTKTAPLRPFAVSNLDALLALSIARRSKVRFDKGEAGYIRNLLFTGTQSRYRTLLVLTKLRAANPTRLPGLHCTERLDHRISRIWWCDSGCGSGFGRNVHLVSLRLLHDILSSDTLQVFQFIGCFTKMEASVPQGMGPGS